MAEKLANIVVILAAGRGARTGAANPKQYHDLAGRPILRHTLECFGRADNIDAVQMVIHDEDQEAYNAAINGTQARMLEPVIGGATRQKSVLCGLEAIAGYQPENVLIHDAARPFVSADIIGRIIKSLKQNKAAIPLMPVVDTIKRVNKNIIIDTLERNDLAAAQTPQGFDFDDILAAHRAAAQADISNFSDDAALAQWAGLEVAGIEGAPENFKITTAHDLVRAQLQAGTALETRLGQGFDVHKFSSENKLILCGVKIKHEQGLAGHSDADVALHALCDALLGAIGAGDIGTHFPPSDDQWKGVDSSIFVEKARSLVTEAGGRIVNVDITLICEAPKIGPHRNAMVKSVAGILKIDETRISIKATTSEGLGFTGRGEGIAAMATASIALPAST